VIGSFKVFVYLHEHEREKKTLVMEQTFLYKTDPPSNQISSKIPYLVHNSLNCCNTMLSYVF
jgi:hypothetical protein